MIKPFLAAADGGEQDVHHVDAQAGRIRGHDLPIASFASSGFALPGLGVMSLQVRQGTPLLDASCPFEFSEEVKSEFDRS